jgi:flagellar basal-body rod protein FlgC
MSPKRQPAPTDDRLEITLRQPVEAVHECLPHAAMSLGAPANVPRMVARLVIERTGPAWTLYRLDAGGGFVAVAEPSRRALGALPEIGAVVRTHRIQQVLVAPSEGIVGGVEIADVVADTTSDFKSVYMPGHPHAGKDGMVRMPNVDLPVEMMNMVVASRAYQANAAVLKRYQDSVDTTLELLR